MENNSAHGALLLAQLIGSFNNIISRAAFAQDEGAPQPLTFAVWRVLIASVVLTGLRCVFLRRRTPPPPSDASPSSPMSPSSQAAPMSPSQSIINEIEDNEPRTPAQKMAIESAKSSNAATAAALSMSASPMMIAAAAAAASSSSSSSTLMSIYPGVVAPTPSVKQILHVCGLGIFLIAFNYTFYFFGVAMTDAITVAAMMCAVPPICFVLGYLLGFESFTIPKALATILVVCGNAIMAHLWRIVVPDDASDAQQQQQHAAVAAAHHHHDHHIHAHSAGSGQKSAASSYQLGVFFLFLAFTCWSLYLHLQRQLVQSMHVLDFLFYLHWSCCAGLITISIAHPEGDEVFKQVFSSSTSSSSSSATAGSSGLSLFSWGAILYAGCLQSIGTYGLVSYGTAKADSSILAAIYQALQPLMIAIEAIFLLNETMDQWQVIGGAVVILGWVCSLVAVARDAPAGAAAAAAAVKERTV